MHCADTDLDSGSNEPSVAAREDHELLRQFMATGNAEPIGALFRRHADAVYRVALRCSGNRPDAEDAVQTAFLQVMRRAHQFRGVSTVRAWLLRIVINCCRMKIRADAGRLERERRATPFRGEAREPDTETAELATQVVNAVKRLPEHYRMPVWLRYVEGLSFGETATALSANEKTVREQARRGIHRVRESLTRAGFGGSVAGVTSVEGQLASLPLSAAPAAVTAYIAAAAKGAPAAAAKGAGVASAAPKAKLAATSAGKGTSSVVFMTVAGATLSVAGYVANLQSSKPSTPPVAAPSAPLIAVAAPAPAAAPRPSPVIFATDFESAADLENFSGQRVLRPDGVLPGNRHCIMGNSGDGGNVAVHWQNWTAPLFKSTLTEEIEFDYYLSTRSPWACITLVSAGGKTGYDVQLDPRTVGRWSHAKLRVRDFTKTGHPDENPPRGFAVNAVIIQCEIGAGRCLYVDNFKVTTSGIDADPPRSSGVESSQPR